MPTTTQLLIPDVNTAAQMMVKAYSDADFEQVKNIENSLHSKELSEKISGTSDEFHNAAVALTRAGMFYQAYNLILTGLERAPKNTDLLSDALKYGMHCHVDPTALDGLCGHLNRINKRFWSWRAYQFCFDYLMERLPYCETDEELNKKESEIRNLIAEFKAHIDYLADYSDSEKAYMMDYEFHMSKGDAKGATAALLEAINHDKLKNKCAQCALKMADYCFEHGDYSEVIPYAERAVSIKEDQQSINLGYTYYILAMSREWANRGDIELGKAKGVLKQIYQEFFSAYLYLEAGRDNLMESIKKQVKILEFKTGQPSGIPFEDLDEEKNAVGLNMIRTLFEQAKRTNNNKEQRNPLASMIDFDND